MMVESDAYFEAYRHVLDGLKAIDVTRMPFSEYLVHCYPEIENPQYTVRGNTYVSLKLTQAWQLENKLQGLLDI